MGQLRWACGCGICPLRPAGTSSSCDPLHPPHSGVPTACTEPVQCVVWAGCQSGVPPTSTEVCAGRTDVPAAAGGAPSRAAALSELSSGAGHDAASARPADDRAAGGVSAGSPRRSPILGIVQRGAACMVPAGGCHGGPGAMAAAAPLPPTGAAAGFPAAPAESPGAEWRAGAVPTEAVRGAADQRGDGGSAAAMPGSPGCAVGGAKMVQPERAATATPSAGAFDIASWVHCCFQGRCLPRACKLNLLHTDLEH